MLKNLTDHQWQTKYDSDSSSLVKEFYEPALNCAIRYDRSTGFFSAKLLALAARGIESLVHNNGKMRLVIGCTLGEEEVKAIERGEKLREVVGNRLCDFPLKPTSTYEINALELLAWMIGKDYLDVKLAIPCSIKERKPVASYGIFHEKAGIIEDKLGNRLAFNGSVNETAQGWSGNWESFHVFTDWNNSKNHVDEEERSFAKLWNNQATRCLVIDVQTAIKAELLKFLPSNDHYPVRLKTPDTKSSEKVEKSQAEAKADQTPVISPTNPPEALEDRFKKVWAIIQHGPAITGKGDRVGEATSIIKPFPHQVKTFQRLYNNYPPKLLIADEVGLGKTIEAGLLLRQAWLSGKAKRILILAPKAVLTQWQIELREKFNLNIPIYNGKTFTWYNSPGRNILGQPREKPISRQEWHKESLVIVSSHLMRRKDRAKELIEEADPYDLIFLDEAHHARRQGDKGPNQLLSLMQRLKNRTQGLVLLTATPMQVDPIEVWDLMNLLGLPLAWNADSFEKFFEYASSSNPSHPQFEFMAGLFRSVEEYFGQTPQESIMRYVPNQSNLSAKKILKALRDEAQLPRKQLNTEQRKVAIKIMQTNTPVAKLISRHTRELLRRYYEAGKISSRIASRVVKDDFVVLSSIERELYEAIENYISSTYNNASQAERNAVGFVMTIYRRRLASSFTALENTLKKRVEAIKHKSSQMTTDDIDALQEDLLDDETDNEVMEAEDANQLEQEALKREEVTELELLLQRVRQLPTDTKAKNLLNILQEIKKQDYKQIIIFTQYTDTMDFLRKFLFEQSDQQKIICFSGRGGELPNGDGSWRNVSRDETKRIFREGKADILICTDAAAEGLNFQFCGALINYDMPWNPMRVEQRIGRIDRLGQIYESIQIVNLHYQDTVETDVYVALKERIGLFSQYVGKLQPILATLSKNIASIVLARGDDREQQKESILSDIDESRRQAEANSFDIDAITEEDLNEPPTEEALYDLDALDLLLHHPNLLPPGLQVETMTTGEYKFSMPGMSSSLRITTKSDYFEQHPESVELWSPGSPLFPVVQEELEEAISCDLKSLL